MDTKDTIARTPVTESVEPEVKVEVKAAPQGVSKVEGPYTNYEQAHGYPYIVDHFKLGDSWAETQGGFPKEVSLIEEYITNKINSGDMPDNVDSIKDMIKKIEKVTNLDKNERPVVKVETIAAYVEFLMKADKIKFNLRRYGK